MHRRHPLDRRQIENTLRAAGLGPGMWARAARREAPAAAEDGSLGWILTSELPAIVFDWERLDFISEVLLAEGMRAPAIGQVPLLDSHSRHSVADVLGHVNALEAAQAEQYRAISGRVFFASDEASQIARQKVLDGHITDGSVGYAVDNQKSIWIPEGTAATVRGVEYQGPVVIRLEWSLREFSLVPIGADVLAKVRQMCGR